VRVTLSVADTYAKLEVIDTGHGIDPAFLPYVFERFRQADSSITRAHGGLGLGLAIVRHLTEMHGGSVSADSGGNGEGSTFTVRLPLMGVRLDIERDAVSDGDELSLHGVRVLVVDDDADSRDVLAMALGHFGAEVRTCANGDQALADLMTWHPSILVSDIAMSGMNGHELIRRIRELDVEKGGAVPAIALSAYSRGEDRKQSLAAGYQLHITKPFDPGQIAAEVARLSRRD
jgi:CheY-like chemotaxis protein